MESSTTVLREESVAVVDAGRTVVVTTPSERHTSVEIRQRELVTERDESVVVVSDTDIVVIAAGQQGPPGAGGDGDCCIDDDVVAPDSTFSSEYIMELLNPFALSSFSLSPTSATLGATVTSLTFNWATNYAPDTVSISGGVGAVTLPATSLVATVSLTASTTFTLSAVRNGVTKTANASISFLNRVYYGVNLTQTTDEATLEAMTGVLSGSRGRSITFNCTGGRYFHYAYPSRLGAASFQINNLTYSDVTLTVVPITNAAGYTENYNVYYCNVIQNGAAITLVVS